MENLENKVEEKSFWSRAKNKTAVVLGAAVLFAYGVGGCGSKNSDVIERSYFCRNYLCQSNCTDIFGGFTWSEDPQYEELNMCVDKCTAKLNQCSSQEVRIIYFCFLDYDCDEDWQYCLRQYNDIFQCINP